MKVLILSLGLMAVPAYAEVLECPAKYQGARLVGVGMYEGEHKVELMGGPRKVRDGVDIDFGFNAGETKWIACRFEPATQVWYRLSPAVTRCVLKKRGAVPGKVTAKVRCE